MRTRGTPVVVAALLLVGCGNGESEPEATELQPPETTAEVTVDVVACDSAMAEIAEAEQADAETLRPAFEACISVPDFVRAAERNPDAIDGEDPAQFAAEQCESEPELADTLLCQSL